MLTFFKRNSFMSLLIPLFLISDLLITHWDPVNDYEIFYQNDYEKTAYHNPQEEWPKVFFGNSTVAAAYNQDESDSSFVNLGLSYGKLTDLEEMLKEDYLPGTKELAIGLNMFTLMDDLPTDPSYEWHREFYQPYPYFHRDQISQAIDKYGSHLLEGDGIKINRKQLYQKELYYGTLKGKDLKEKIEEYDQNYATLSIEDYDENIQSLSEIVEFADKNGIKIKVLWMPWNPEWPVPKHMDQVEKRINEISTKHNVKVTNWENKFKPEQFHDLGHLNVERGRPLFTKEIDSWLKN